MSREGQRASGDIYARRRGRVNPWPHGWPGEMASRTVLFVRDKRGSDGRRRVLALAGAGAGFVVAVLYVRLIAGQGTPITDRVVLVAAFIAAMAVFALLAGIRKGDDAVGSAAAITAASGLIAVGFIGMFSVGIPLLMSAFLTLAGAFPTRVRGWVAAVAIAAPVITLAAGLLLTAD